MAPAIRSMDEGDNIKVFNSLLFIFNFQKVFIPLFKQFPILDSPFINV